MPSIAPNILHGLIIIVKAYQFPQAAVTKFHKLRGLKQWEFILSWFWKLKVQNQVVSRAMVPLKALGKVLLLLAFLMSLGLWQHDSNLCFCLYMSLCVCVPMSKFPSFYRDTSHIGLRTHPNLTCPDLDLIISAKTLFPNKITFTGSMSGHESGGMLLHPVGEVSRFWNDCQRSLPHIPLFTPCVWIHSSRWLDSTQWLISSQ